MSSESDQPMYLDEAHARNAGARVSLKEMLAISRNVIEEFRANGGKVSGMFAEEPLLLGEPPDTIEGGEGVSRHYLGNRRSHHSPGCWSDGGAGLSTTNAVSPSRV